MRIVIVFLIILLSACIVYVGVQVTRRLQLRRLVGASIAAGLIYAGLLYGQAGHWLVSDLVVLAVAVLGGSLVGRMLSSQVALLTFCIVAAVVDVVSFSGGLTAMISEQYRAGESLLLQYLTVAFPLEGRVQPLVGVSDLYVLSTLFYAFDRLDFGGVGAFLFPLGGLLVALVVGLIGGGIYALPFICGGALLHLALASRRAGSDTS